MKQFICFASLFEDAVDVERDLKFDPLDLKCTMEPQKIEGATVNDAMQKFVSTDALDCFWEQHKKPTIFLYYVDVNGALVRFDEMFDI